MLVDPSNLIEMDDPQPSKPCHLIQVNIEGEWHLFEVINHGQKKNQERCRNLQEALLANGFDYPIRLLLFPVEEWGGIAAVAIHKDHPARIAMKESKTKYPSISKIISDFSMREALAKTLKDAEQALEEFESKE